MNIEDQVDNILQNLKIIASVQKNGKLCIRKGSLTLESSAPYQNLRRWINNDSRDLCIMHIKNTINNAIKLKKNIINKVVDVELHDWTIERLTIEMRNCQVGLQNLKVTYNDDTSVKSMLDVLLERLQVESGSNTVTVI